MTEAVTKTSTLIVTTPRALTNEQQTNIRDAIAGQLPPDVGVILFDPRFTVRHIGQAGPELDLAVGEMQPDYTSAEILVELKALRADLAAQFAKAKAFGFMEAAERVFAASSAPANRAGGADACGMPVSD